MYIVEITVNSTPDKNGWSDFITVLDGGKTIFTGIGSTAPNPVQARTSLNWKQAYGWIATGIHEIETVNHYKYGKSVLINGGGEVPARFPNSNHDGRCILTELLIHAGNRNSTNKEWRGSAGCPTIHPRYWDQFSDNLPSGKGLLIIRDGAI